MHEPSDIKECSGLVLQNRVGYIPLHNIRVMDLSSCTDNLERSSRSDARDLDLLEFAAAALPLSSFRAIIHR